MEQNPATSDVCGSETCILYVPLRKVGEVQGLCTHIDLSLEFLMGRALDNAMLNVGLKDVAKGSASFPLPLKEVTDFTRQPVCRTLGSELRT